MNYESDLVYIWIANDFELYQEAMELKRQGVSSISRWIDEELLEYPPESLSGLTLDLFRAAVARVDARAVAIALCEE